MTGREDATVMEAGDRIRRLSWLNLESGDVSRLARLVAPLTDPHASPAADVPVAIVGLCEAKFWARRGRQPFLAALHELSVLHARPYVGELNAGPLGAAVIYDPNALCLTQAEEPEFADARSRTDFRLRATNQQLRVCAEHWSYCDRRERFARAQRLAQHGDRDVPTLIAGDLNESLSGDGFPDLDWDAVPIAVRDYVGRRTPEGTWERETDALDRLIGRAVPGSRTRADGSGFHHVAELDLKTARPYPATSNVRNLHVDHALLNLAMLRVARVVPGSYMVHVPRGKIRAQWPSDHRRVSVTPAFPAAFPAALVVDQSDAEAGYRMTA